MRRKDFGTKVGGAKKDLWKERNLTLEDLSDMNGLEMDKNINKNNIWKKPEYIQYREAGIPLEVVYFYKQIRDSLPSKPPAMQRMTSIDLQREVENQQKLYLEFISEIRDMTLACKTIDDIRNFYDKNIANSKYFFYKKGSTRPHLAPEYNDIFTSKFNKACQVTDYRLASYKMDILKKEFCFTDTEKLLAKFKYFEVSKDSIKQMSDGSYVHSQFKGMNSVTIYLPNECHPEDIKEDCVLIFDTHNKYLDKAPTLDDARKYIVENYTLDSFEKKSNNTKTRKKRYVPKTFEQLKRVGPNYRGGMNIKEDEFKKTFGTPWIEFGEYLSDSETIASANSFYDSLMDMCRALNMSPEDASLGGRVSIGFGSRGSGAAMAHYELENEIINLTKKRGPGALGHEFGHAIDDICAKKLMLKGEMSSCFWHKNALPEIKTLLESFRTQNGQKTDFFKGSVYFDQNYSVCGNGYWASNCEMFARAFQCYLEDKVAEKNAKNGEQGRNDYLCGYASTYTVKTMDGDVYRAYPTGEERETINKNFDNLFDKMRDLGLIHKWTPEMEKKYIQPNIMDYIRESQEKENQKQNETPKLRVLIVEPNKNPREAYIDDTLEAKQEIVGGLIEEAYHTKDSVVICNEEGRLINLPQNRLINNDNLIVGTFLIAGDNGGPNYVSLTDEQVKEYTEKYKIDIEINNEQSKPKTQFEPLKDGQQSLSLDFDSPNVDNFDNSSTVNNQQTKEQSNEQNNKEEQSNHNEAQKNAQNEVKLKSSKRKDGNDQIQFDF